MNHTDNGMVAIGAPGSIARAMTATEELAARGIHIDPKLSHLSAIAAFTQAYTEELTIELEKNPTNYAWPASNIPVVVKRMTDAIYHGRFANSNCLRRVSRRLGLNGSQRQLAAFVRAALA